ncbi:MAG: polyisoprenoid-binding protein [Betaproteobacteria bacterium]|nr:polyisoprenoid-binding protein [Betaproteobacteria bacterium]
MKNWVLFLLATVALPSLAAPLAVDPAKSEITFVSKQMGVPVDGRFRIFTAKVDFDAMKPENAKVRLDVSIASIDAGSSEANEEVKGKNWLNAAKFPRASFVSTAVKRVADDRYEVTGNMTIRGTTKPLTTPFTMKTQGDARIFEGAFVMNRNDFGIGQGPWADPETVANEIQVRFRLKAMQDKK